MLLAIILLLCKKKKKTKQKNKTKQKTKRKQKRFLQKRSINIYTENKTPAPVEKFSSS